MSGDAGADVGKKPALHCVIDLLPESTCAFREVPEPSPRSTGPSKSGRCGKTGSGNDWGTPEWLKLGSRCSGLSE